jgi:competence protein ComEC
VQVTVATATLALAAVLLGAGLRFAETVAAAARPVLALTDERQLARIEATLVDPFIERSGSTDILARHLARPPKFQAVVEDIVFVHEDGTRSRTLDAESRLTVSATERPPDLLIGSRLSIVGWLRGPPTPTLPGSERIGEHLALAGIAGGIMVESLGTISTIDEATGGASMRWAAMRLRCVVRDALRTGLLAGVPDDEESGGWAVRSMLVALVLGDVEVGYRAIDDSFRAVGLSHILAISGFNLAVLGWVAATAARLVSRDERMHAVAVGVAALLALCLMAPAASAIRSALMSIVGACGASFGRAWNGDAVLALTAIAMLTTAPSDATNAGFQLSFACVLALRHLSPMVAWRWLRWMPADDASRLLPVWIALGGTLLSRALAAGLAAFLTSVPIVLCHFGTFQPFGVLLTLLCSPLATLALVVAYPKGVIGAVLAAWFPDATAPIGPVLWLPAWLQVEIVDRAILLGAGSFAPGAIHWLAAIVMLVTTAGALLASARIARFACAATAAAACVIGPVGRSDDALRGSGSTDEVALRVTMFAVGDGSAYALESGGALALFDAGSSSHGSIGGRALLPWVIARGGRVDAIVVSHPDIDHFSAVADLIRHAHVDSIHVHDSIVEIAAGNIAAAELLDAARLHGTRIVVIGAGDRFTVGSSEWTVLWPERGWRSRRDNDISLVVRVEGTPDQGGRRASILLTGDIETEPAALLTVRARDGLVDLRCDLMELPHHGSWREAIVPLVAIADPAVVLQSTASRRWRSDRFAPHLLGRHRLVTCRDGTVQAVMRRCGGIELFAWDPHARGNWRPAGSVAPFERRPRGVVRPRRLMIRRSAVVLSRGSSARAKEHRAAQHDAVTSGAVSAIGDVDDEFRAFQGGGRWRRGRTEREDAPPGGVIKPDPCPGFIADRRDDFDGRIGGRRLGERDLGREDERRACSHKRIGNREADAHASIERDLAEAKNALARVLDPRRLLERVSESIRRWRWKSHVACGERMHGVWIEDEGDRGGCHRSGAVRLGSGDEQRVCESEDPASIAVELDAIGPDMGSIRKPHGDAACGRLPHLRERDRGNALRGDPTHIRGAAWLVARAGLLRCVGLGRILRRLSLIGLPPWRRVEGLEKEFASERIDEPGDCVPIQEQNRVRIGAGDGAGLCLEADLGHSIEVDGDRPDPAVLPRCALPIETELSRQKLSVIENERARCELREEGHVARKRRSDETGDDLVPRDPFAARRAGEDERVGIERCKATCPPESIAKKELHGDRTLRFASLRRRGHRQGLCVEPLCREEPVHRGRKKQAGGHRPSDQEGGSTNKGGERRANTRRRRHEPCASMDDGGAHGKRMATTASALEDREIALGHLKNDQRHRGPVRITLRIGPGAVRTLLRKKFVADGRPPVLPSVATRQIHGLHRVVVPVEVVRLGEPSADAGGVAAWERVLTKIVEPTLDRLVLVDPGVEQARNPRGGPRPGGSTEVLHVPESAIGVLTRADIPRGVVDRGLRDLDPGIARTAQGHDLTDGHGDIGVVGHRVVTPSAFVVLARNDQLDRAHQRVADTVVVPVHAVDLAEEQRGEAVAVHRAMRLVGDEQARLGRVRKNEVQRLLNLLGEVAATRHVSIGHEGDGAQARDADVLPETALAERAIGLLLSPQILEALAHRFLKLRRDLVGGRRVLGADGLRPRVDAAPIGCHWVRGHWRRCRGGNAVLTSADRAGKGRRGSRGHLALRKTKPGGRTESQPPLHRRILRWVGCIEIEIDVVVGNDRKGCGTPRGDRGDRARPRPKDPRCEDRRLGGAIGLDGAASDPVEAQRPLRTRARGPPARRGRKGRSGSRRRTRAEGIRIRQTQREHEDRSPER